MDFSDALNEIKKGKKVTNTNWNGKGQYIFLMKGYNSIPANQALSDGAGITLGEDVKIAPYLMLNNAQGVFVNWVPSIGDIFSEDWEILDDSSSENEFTIEGDIVELYSGIPVFKITKPIPINEKTAKLRALIENGNIYIDNNGIREQLNSLKEEIEMLKWKFALMKCK